MNHVCTLSGHSKTINCVRVSPTGRHLVSTADGGEILLWQPNDSSSSAAAAASSLPKGNLVEADSETDGTPVWRRVTTLRGHNDDVMDVSWATDGTALLTGSIDNKAIIWEVSDKNRGKILAQLANHKHFIQGVAWDPAQQFVVTQSTDRTCRVYSLKPPASGRKRSKHAQWALPAAQTASDFYCSHTLSKRSFINKKNKDLEAGKETTTTGAVGGEQLPDTNPLAPSPQQQQQQQQQQQKHPLFHDETINSFFRRLSWSPDGSFLVIPAGVFPSHRYQDSTGTTGTTKSKVVLNTAYIYARGKWAAPVMHLPGHDRPIVAVRFCPVAFACDKEKDDGRSRSRNGGGVGEATTAEDTLLPLSPTEGSTSAACNDDNKDTTTTNTLQLSSLPYKMVFAVATTDSVIIYDTQSTVPVAVLGALHYASITDLAWSSDGTYLAVGSKDGYCSVAVFDKGELGEPMKMEELPGHIAKRMSAAQRKIAPTVIVSNRKKAAGGGATQRKGVEEKAAAVVVVATGGGGGEVAAASTMSLPLSQQQQDQQPDQQKKKRIQPELIAHPCSTTPMDVDKKQQPERERIVAEAIGPVVVEVPQQQEKQVQDAAAAAAAANNSGGKRRITPTVINTSPEEAFIATKINTNNVVAMKPSNASEIGNSGGCGRSEKKRRITPILIGVNTAQLSPGVQVVKPSEQKEEVAAPVSGGMSIAALAMLAGQNAAEGDEEKRK